MKKLFIVKLYNAEAQDTCRALVSVPDTPQAEQKAEIAARCIATTYKSAWRLEWIEFVCQTHDVIVKEV